MHPSGLPRRSRCGVGVRRCVWAGGLVGTVPVVVLDILSEHGFEVASSEDEHAVQALAPYGPHESFGDYIRPRRPDRGLKILMPSTAKAASKDRLNLESRSRITHLTAFAVNIRSLDIKVPINTSDRLSAPTRNHGLVTVPARLLRSDKLGRLAQQHRLDA